MRDKTNNKETIRVGNHLFTKHKQTTLLRGVRDDFDDKENEFEKFKEENKEKMKSMREKHRAMKQSFEGKVEFITR